MIDRSDTNNHDRTAVRTPRTATADLRLAGRIREALHGRVTEHHRFLLRALLD